MSDDSPEGWFIPTTFKDGERGYLLTREGVIFFAMKTDGDVATRAQVEIAQIVAAWYRGEIVPRSTAPTLAKLLERDDWEKNQPPEPVPAPMEIVGGVSGLQKHLVKLAEANRGLDHAALKELYDAHQVVIAVWQTEEDRVPGPGFLTLKGTEHLLAQAKRGAKKIRATMTAIPCRNKQHAELLQQAFEQGG